MSSDNPYNSPGEPPVAALPPRTTSSGQPSGFMAICVIAIILGGMGTLASLMGVIGLIAAPAIQSLATARQPGQPQAMHDLNVEMQREIAEVTDHWKPFSFAIVTVHLLVSAGMLLGAIFCIRRNPTGIPLLSYSTMAAIGYEGLNLLMQIVVQMETFPITSRYVQRIMEATPGNNAPPEMGKFMANAMVAGMWVTIGILVFWTLAKVVFDVIAIRYMSREDVRGKAG
jgi:hypothetical protein